MVEIIGRIQTDLDKLQRWAKQQPVAPLLKSNYARGRLEYYYGLAVDLKKQPKITPAHQDSRVNGLGDQLLPDWHSALLCKYLPGIGINPHRDHTCFQPWAVMVNIGDANFFEYNGREKVVTRLDNGVIVRINTKVLHGVEPVQSVRYSLTFRHIKAQFLTLPIEF
ncbi:MAG: 2OG-Fe(II) oxygenase family protein [Cyanobacteria bacterium P01_F01_bin.13]